MDLIRRTILPLPLLRLIAHCVNYVDFNSDTNSLHFTIFFHSSSFRLRRVSVFSVRTRTHSDISIRLFCSRIVMKCANEFLFYFAFSTLQRTHSLQTQNYEFFLFLFMLLFYSFRDEIRHDPM